MTNTVTQHWRTKNQNKKSRCLSNLSNGDETQSELSQWLRARLTAEQAGWVLNCQTHDVLIQVVAQAVGNSAAKQRQIFLVGGSLGTGQGSCMARSDDQCNYPALAGQESAQKSQQFGREWERCFAADWVPVMAGR